MNTGDYMKTLEAVFDMKIAEAERHPRYSLLSAVYEEYNSGLNEGYIAGLREALRTIQASAFLVQEA